ncbi:DnaJ C-terminal domain-containing protein [Hyphococcus sp.]|uniref:DnaJ C-terminal domain-containing protein n=1 Tax=Hyphococcus sp. TaxID=2038636 RepID=UPI003CCBC10C
MALERALFYEQEFNGRVKRTNAAGEGTGEQVAKNPYLVLGLSPKATDAEIRSAFRQLAKKYHPDRNPGDKKSEDKFKEVSAAFDILGDPERRKKYDRGELDDDGRERPNPFHQWTQREGGRPGQGGYGGAQAGGPGAGASFEDFSDIFSDLFGARGTRGGGGHHMRGRDVRYRLEVDFLDAVNGAKKRVTMPDGKNLDLSIPAGFEDGQTLRLKGQGEKAPGGAGDVYVEVKVKPHAIFERKGDDIHMEAPISLKEAVLGGKITAPTVAGDVSVNVPKYSSSGTVLRLKGRGAPKRTGGAGDQYVKLKIVLPEGGDKALEEFVKNWKGADQKARKDFAGA